MTKKKTPNLFFHNRATEVAGDQHLVMQKLQPGPMLKGKLQYKNRHLGAGI